jgi:outer membrane autotransporter protein
MSLIHYKTPYIEETSAELGCLRVNRNQYTSLRVPIGVRLNSDMDVQGMRFTPEFRMAYLCEMADTSIASKTAWATNLVNTMPVYAGVRGSTAFCVGVGLNAQIRPRITLGVGYNGELWDGFSRHDVGGHATFIW